ncbi:MAG: sensor protein fixL [Verrucomicrobiales bacterium]|nr:sensor protein fixL [Verrucomicrobiales bacterium]
MQALTNKILAPNFGGEWAEGAQNVLAFESSPFPMCILDEETLGYLAVNDAEVKLYGYSREEFLSMTLREIRPDEPPEVLLEELESARNTSHGVWYSRITRHRKRDGTFFKVQVRRRRISFFGRPALLCSLEDVTHHVKTSEDLSLPMGANAALQERAAEFWAATLELRGEASQRKRLERRNAAFLKLGQSMSAATTAYAAAKIIADVALELFGWDAYTLDLFSAETNDTIPILYCDTINGQRTEVQVNQPREKLTRRALRIISKGSELILKPDDRSDSQNESFFGDTSRVSASLMFVPIQSRSKPIGTLSVQSYVTNAYTKDDLRTLQALADHCAGALERVSAEQALRKFEERNTTLLTTSNLRLQFEINRRYHLEKRNEALSKLGRSLSAARTAREAAWIIGTAADELLGWDCCNFQIYRAEEKKVDRVLNVDTINNLRSEVPPGKNTELTPILKKVLEEGPQLILRKEPIVFDGITRPFGDVHRPSASLMFVPVRQGNAVKGFCSIQSYTMNAYTPDDLQTLLVLADHCVGALERIWVENALLQSEAQKNTMLSAANIKLQREITERHRLEKELLETADNERRRIGQDLHDDVGQQLTGINLLSQGLALRLAKKKMRAESTEASRIRRLTVQTLQRARALAHGLANFQFNENDLVVSLEHLADQTKKNLKISCSVKVTGKVVHLQTEVARQLYSITQEAVTNAIKHGRARVVQLQLTFTQRKLTLVVKNDGRRFVAHQKENSGMGLRIMQYRASVIGATLQLRPNGTRGTLLVCGLPLKGLLSKPSAAK